MAGPPQWCQSLSLRLRRQLYHKARCQSRPSRPVLRPSNSPVTRRHLSKRPIQGSIQMAIERTFSIIKPDAVRRNLIGKILTKFEEAGLRPIAFKKIHMTRAQAEGFYAVHKERPFFGELVEQMIASPVVVQVLEGEGAILKNREIMGATNPANAADGTIRKEFALSIGENSVHGSDAPETAAQEIKFFFNDDELVG